MASVDRCVVVCVYGCGLLRFRAEHGRRADRRYSLKVGDHVLCRRSDGPVTSTVTKAGPALVCSPGTPGTRSQGSPAVRSRQLGWRWKQARNRWRRPCRSEAGRRSSSSRSTSPASSGPRTAASAAPTRGRLGGAGVLPDLNESEDARVRLGMVGTRGPSENTGPECHSRPSTVGRKGRLCEKQASHLNTGDVGA